MRALPKGPVARAIARRVERILAVVGLLFLVYHGAFHVARITSPSMQPTLLGHSMDDGDSVLTERWTGRWRRPQRFEVIALVSEDGVHVMKRVFGLPGETIAMRDNRILIDGAPLALPPQLAALRYYAYGNLTGGKTVACGDGYFVLGDDSTDSQDSRWEGPFPRHRIEGRALAVLTPVSRLGWVR